METDSSTDDRLTYDYCCRSLKDKLQLRSQADLDMFRSIWRRLLVDFDYSHSAYGVDK